MPCRLGASCQVRQSVRSNCRERERKMRMIKTYIGCCALMLSVTAWAHELAPDPAKQKLSDLLKKIGIKRGSIVAEVSSGVGFRLDHYLDAVGTDGIIFAVAFHQENVDKIREKALQNGWKNIRPTLGSHVGEQVNLPENKVEWVVVM